VVHEVGTTVERDGLVFDVTTAGPPDGEPVVLLHGFPQSARCWDAVTPVLNAAGRFAIQLQGKPSRSNPKTSALAAMSVARALLNARATIVI